MLGATCGKLRLVIVEECRRGTTTHRYNRALCDGALWPTNHLDKKSTLRNV